MNIVARCVCDGLVGISVGRGRPIRKERSDGIGIRESRHTKPTASAVLRGESRLNKQKSGLYRPLVGRGDRFVRSEATE